MEIFVGLGILCVASLLVYALAANPKLVELARLTFAVTLLALCLGAGPEWGRHLR
jgi:hypothetical protein